MEREKKVERRRRGGRRRRADVPREREREREKEKINVRGRNGGDRRRATWTITDGGMGVITRKKRKIIGPPSSYGAGSGLVG